MYVLKLSNILGGHRAHYLALGSGVLIPLRDSGTERADAQNVWCRRVGVDDGLSNPDVLSTVMKEISNTIEQNQRGAKAAKRTAAQAVGFSGGEEC